MLLLSGRFHRPKRRLAGPEYCPWRRRTLRPGYCGSSKSGTFILGYAEINDPRARRLGAAFHRKHLFDIAPPHPIWCTTCGSQSNLVEQLSYREELVLMIYG